MVKFLTQLFLLTLFTLIVAPILWIMITAFRHPRDVYEFTAIFIPTVENFSLIFQSPWFMGKRIVNSLIITFSTIAIAIPVSILAAYAFSRFNFFMKRGLFFMILATQFIPAVAIILPFYLLFRDLGLLDTRIGLVIVNLAIVTPYAVWMLKGFVDSVPFECEESAMIDGASRLKIVQLVIIPMIMPGIIATAVFYFILAWTSLFLRSFCARKCRDPTSGSG